MCQGPFLVCYIGRFTVNTSLTPNTSLYEHSLWFSPCHIFVSPLSMTPKAVKLELGMILHCVAENYAWKVEMHLLSVFNLIRTTTLMM